MLNKITPGCSVKLRNGMVVNNIHLWPEGGNGSQIVAIKDGELPKVNYGSLKNMQSTGGFLLGWCKNGHYHSQRESEVDIIEVLTTKEIMTIPARNSPEFGDYMKSTHEAFLRDKRVGVKSASVCTWQTTEHPSWNWDQFDYKPVEKPKYKWFTIEDVLSVLSLHFLIRREDTKEVYTAHYSVQRGYVVVVAPFTTITEDSYLYETGRPRYEYSNDNITWKELVC